MKMSDAPCPQTVHMSFFSNQVMAGSTTSAYRALGVRNWSVTTMNSTSERSRRMRSVRLMLPCWLTSVLPAVLKMNRILLLSVVCPSGRCNTPSAAVISVPRTTASVHLKTGMASVTGLCPAGRPPTGSGRATE